MSTRRCLKVLAITTLAALCLAPAAGARTKVVLVGGPAPAGTPGTGSIKFPRALDLNGFFRRKVTIHVGDSVRWDFSRRVVHTVTFLPPGQKRPPLEASDPANPYSGFSDAAGAAFWFNSQPGISIPPEHAFPQGGGSTDGTAYRNSGLSAPAFKPYRLKFTKAGTFRYLCLVHPGMAGTVRVVPRNRAVPSGAADRRARRAEMSRAVKRGRQLGKFSPSAPNVVAGHDRGTVAWFRFFPRTTTISAGQSLHFSIDSTSEIHTVAFGPEGYRNQIEGDLIRATPQPSGPPLLQFNPLIFLPSDPTLPAYSGTNHGNGFLNTGVLDTNPATPPPSSADVTFSTPGTYVFECTIHPGMEATVKVT
jgi:plastocyanin